MLKLIVNIVWCQKNKKKKIHTLIITGRVSKFKAKQKFIGNKKALRDTDTLIY